MESLKSNVMLGLLLLLSTTMACNRDRSSISIQKDKPITDLAATTKAGAVAKALGRWELIEVKQGWTAVSKPPIKKTEIVVDDALRIVFFEDGREVSRYKYLLEETPTGLRYSTIEQSGKPSIYLQPDGNFRVTEKRLVVGDTGNDGNDYVFERRSSIGNF